MLKFQPSHEMPHVSLFYATRVISQNNPDEHSLESRLLDKLKGDVRNNGKILITLEHIAEWQPDCWERRSYKYSK